MTKYLMEGIRVVVIKSNRSGIITVRGSRDINPLCIVKLDDGSRYSFYEKELRKIEVGYND